MLTIMQESTSDPCPFCHVSLDRVIERTEHAFSMLDAYPVSPGHTLVIVRRHVASPFDLTAQEAADIAKLVWMTRDRLDVSSHPSGYNLGVNVGTDAGQTVMHMHVHVIPRYSGDITDPAGGVRNVLPGKGRY